MGWKTCDKPVCHSYMDSLSTHNPTGSYEALESGWNLHCVKPISVDSVLGSLDGWLQIKIFHIIYIPKENVYQKRGRAIKGSCDYSIVVGCWQKLLFRSWLVKFTFGWNRFECAFILLGPVSYSFIIAGTAWVIMGKKCPARYVSVLSVAQLQTWRNQVGRCEEHIFTLIIWSIFHQNDRILMSEKNGLLVPNVLTSFPKCRSHSDSYCKYMEFDKNKFPQVLRDLHLLGISRVRHRQSVRENQPLLGGPCWVAL